MSEKIFDIACKFWIFRLFCFFHPHYNFSFSIKILGKWLYLDIDPYIHYQNYGPFEIKHWYSDEHIYRITWRKTNVCFGYAEFYGI